MRIAHIADLHFAHLGFDSTDLLSKRWIGSLNLLFNRRKTHQIDHLARVCTLFEDLEVDFVFISGDLTTTAHPKEYRAAAAFVSDLEKRGFATLLIPGNHDHYTKKAEKEERFYKYVVSSLPPLSSQCRLQTHKVAAYQLPDGWIAIALDTALATPFYSSNGLFSPSMEKHVQSLLDTLPQNAPIVLINHFPLCPKESPRRHLRRADKLMAILQKDPRVRLYLHGHTHMQSMEDLRKQHLPITLDSGSLCFSQGSWHLLDLERDRCEVTPYRRQGSGWQPLQKEEFIWKKASAIPSPF